MTQGGVLGRSEIGIRGAAWHRNRFDLGIGPSGHHPFRFRIGRDAARWHGGRFQVVRGPTRDAPCDPESKRRGRFRGGVRLRDTT